MTNKQKRHWIVEHIWRGLRASFLIAATIVWLYTDSTHLVLVLMSCAVIVDQFHGFICNSIQKLLHWNSDFNNWS